jgi:hypothetical protein
LFHFLWRGKRESEALAIKHPASTVPTPVAVEVGQTRRQTT